MDDDDDGRGGSSVGGMPKQDSKTMNLFWMYLSSSHDDTLEETRSIDVADGHVTFCWHFKYLGSYVSFSLCDDYDIEKRVVAATHMLEVAKIKPPKKGETSYFFYLH